MNTEVILSKLTLIKEAKSKIKKSLSAFGNVDDIFADYAKFLRHIDIEDSMVKFFVGMTFKGWDFTKTSVKKINFREIKKEQNAFTSLKNVFNNVSCSGFTNEDFRSWIVDNITTMAYMFYNSKDLPSVLDLSSWNTSKLTDVQDMFAYIDIDTLDLTGWDITHLNSTLEWFRHARIGTLKIDGWDFSNYTHSYAGDSTKEIWQSTINKIVGNITGYGNNNNTLPPWTSNYGKPTPDTVMTFARGLVTKPLDGNTYSFAITQNEYNALSEVQQSELLGLLAEKNWSLPTSINK